MPRATGAAGIQQNSSNLDILLHPQQSTRHPQMVVRFDASRIDVHSAHVLFLGQTPGIKKRDMASQTPSSPICREG
jgi:hypothetical protein